MSVTDGQTNGQTPRRWLRREMHSAIARKNGRAENSLVVCGSLASFDEN